ncbi:hypothetical protein GCM10010191_54790 [Actinomadura vinacea]|uniref:DUF397 domain-containing protein n=1 Tax=Actinomadura vinacea TaxID=115336 RepID=A0ABP5WUA4_9ACTN
MSTPRWRKSSRSESGTAVECVELADLGGKIIGVRDSKASEVGHLALDAADFAALVGQIKVGGLDL